MGLLPRMLALKLTKPVVQWFSLEFRPATWCFLDRHGEMWGNSYEFIASNITTWWFVVQSSNMAGRLNIFMFMGMFLPGIWPTMTYKCVIGMNSWDLQGALADIESFTELPGCFSGQQLARWWAFPGWLRSSISWTSGAAQRWFFSTHHSSGVLPSGNLT